MIMIKKQKTKQYTLTHTRAHERSRKRKHDETNDYIGQRTDGWIDGLKELELADRRRDKRI